MPLFHEGTAMSTDESDVRRIAAAAGLAKLEGKHLAQLAEGIASARELAGRLPKDLHWSEEIAPAFRLSQPSEGGRR
jgi:hypothetical protein